MKSSIAIAAMVAFAGAATAQVDVYSSSFEGGDAAGFTGTGDWELGIPVGFVGSNSSVEPVGGNTGDFAWGTIIGGDHNPSTVSSLSQDFNFAGFADVQLSFFEYSASGGNTFDTAQVLVNGDEVYLSDGDSDDAWREVVLDLSAYDGLADVTVDFLFSTTGVVERVGWYIDDVSITAVPAPASAALLGLGGLVATRRRR